MARAANIGCVVCGRVPSLSLTIRRHVGMVFLMRFVRLKASFCRDHGMATTKAYLGKTLVQGWWGILSVFVNVFVIVANLRVLGAYRRVAAPPPVVRHEPGAPIRSMRRFDGSVMPTPF